MSRARLEDADDLRTSNLAELDVTANFHPVAIRASASLLPGGAGEAKGCVTLRTNVTARSASRRCWEDRVVNGMLGRLCSALFLAIPGQFGLALSLKSKRASPGPLLMKRVRQFVK